MSEILNRVAKAICRAECAYRGERPCWDTQLDWDEVAGKYVAIWPNPYCDEPGCIALAHAALEAAALVGGAQGD